LRPSAGARPVPVRPRNAPGQEDQNHYWPFDPCHITGYTGKYEDRKEHVMIQEFSIENTYSIKTRQTVSFEAAEDADDAHCININGKKLLKLAAIYGANASGKSNIIKAFNFYIDFILNSFLALKPQAPIPFTPFLFDSTCRERPGFFEIVFYFEDRQYTYTIELDESFVHNESLVCGDTTANEMVFYRRFKERLDQKIGYEGFRSNGLEEDAELIMSKTRSNASFLSTAAQFNQPQLMEIYQCLVDMIMPAVKPSSRGFLQTTELIEKDTTIKDEILQLMGKADMGLIKDIIIEHEDITEIGLEGRKFKTAGPSTSVSFSHYYDDDVKLPLNYESDGTQRLFALAGPLMRLTHEHTFLAIDEIETSLHDDLLEFFISTFLNNSSRSQLLFTTHNQSLLDSELLSNDEIWFVQKDKTGGSELFSLAEFKDIPPGVSRRKLYKAGTFGALPFISTYTGDT
jgi:AAA15 family ATPase/GTPase